MELTADRLPSLMPCQVLCLDDLSEKAITGGYACDLLSWVISRAKPGDVWLTILNSINVIAVASLADCACVMLTEGTVLAPAILERAREQSVTVLSTTLTTYEAAAALDRLLRQL